VRHVGFGKTKSHARGVRCRQAGKQVAVLAPPLLVRST